MSEVPLYVLHNPQVGGGGLLALGIVCKAHRRLYHSTPGLEVIKKKKRSLASSWYESGEGPDKHICQPTEVPDLQENAPP